MFFFILGHNPTLSVAEILSLLNKRKVDFKSKELSQDVLLLEGADKLEISALFDELGGSIKAGQIYANFNELNANTLKENIGRLLKNKKIFGLSLYNLEKPQENKKQQVRLLKDLAMSLKRRLKNRGISSRFLISPDLALSSVALKKNKILSQGVEIVILVRRDKVYLGQTLMAQAFEDYSFRDFGRPVRSMRRGLLPPKLAKIMINLAQVDHNEAVLDPFCGAGTILQEAMLGGYRKVYGSDIAQEQVEATQKNLEWLYHQKPAPSGVEGSKIKSLPRVESRGQKSKIIKLDARCLSQKILPHSIVAIITEPYLGPPLQRGWPKAKLQKIIRELSHLYLEALSEFRKVLVSSGRVVMIWPVFINLEYPQSRLYLPILEKVKKMGYKIKIPFTRELRNHPVIKVTKRGSIIYSRPDQRVLREIFVMSILRPKQ